MRHACIEPPSAGEYERWGQQAPASRRRNVQGGHHPASSAECGAASEGPKVLADLQLPVLLNAGFAESQGGTVSPAFFSSALHRPTSAPSICRAVLRNSNTVSFWYLRSSAEIG